MDELAELRDILSPEPGTGTPGDDDPQYEAAEPLDGAPPQQLAADAADEGPPLTPEERIAALMAEHGTDQTAEDPSDALATESAEDEDEGDETESDEDIAALLEEGRQARAARAQADAYAPYQGVYAEAEQRVAQAKQHYAQERRRITAAVYADAQRAHDPDAYIAQHLDAAIDGVIAAEDAWVSQVGSDARAAVQRIREEQSKPAWAKFLADERHLPKEAIPRILAIGDPRQMPAIADLLVESRNAMATERRKRTTAERERKAQEIASNQVHAGATGRPAGRKDVQLEGTQEELVAILNWK